MNGETVEVTGSFNGWHHLIQMEPHYFSATNQGSLFLQLIFKLIILII